MGQPNAGIHFMVLGTPRSGSTLVQRLACELPGVRVPPETHFLSAFAPGLLRRRRFPLDAAAVRQELAGFMDLPTSDGLDLDADAVVAELGGACPSALDLFVGVVRNLTGPAEVVGEKTTDHTWWWRPLSDALPHLKVIALVRDPRATVASTLPTPWGSDEHVAAWGADRHLPLALRWWFQERQVAEMQAVLGPGRCLALRYEDLVGDPEPAQARIGAFLGVGGGPVPAASGGAVASGGGPRLFLEWETWKERALRPVTTERVEAWRTSAELSPAQADQVAALCARGMARWGYDQDPGSRHPLVRRLGIEPRDLYRCVRVRRSMRQRLARIERTVL